MADFDEDVFDAQEDEQDPETGVAADVEDQNHYYEGGAFFCG
jgi:hypothetical protein